MNRKLKKEQQKHHICTVARELFTTNGIKKTAIQAVAQAAAVSQVTIYNYFANKQALLDAVCYNLVADICQRRLATIADSSLPLVDRLIHPDGSKCCGHPEFVAYLNQAITTDGPLKALLADFREQTIAALLANFPADEHTAADTLARRVYLEAFITYFEDGNHIAAIKAQLPAQDQVTAFQKRLAELIVYGLSEST